MKRILTYALCLLTLLTLLLPFGAGAAGDAVKPDKQHPITFTPSENFPLPTTATPLPKGHPFTVDGTVRSLAPLLRVRAEILNKRGKTVQSAEKTFAKSAGVTEYQLLDITFSKSIDCLSERIPFQKLGTGTFTLKLSAEDADGHKVELCSAKFKVSAAKWVRLQANNLRGNYTDALRFFGSPERFLFRYKFASGRHITVESAWRKKYLTSVTGVNGKKWGCHVDAAPYFKKATYYIETSYVHIHGDNLDTGAVRLADILTFNGSLVTRYVSTRDFISHHSFGTALDINASSPSFSNKLANREKIYREVTENLTYNGFAEVNGRMCYDFTYTGSAASGPKNVPEPLLNYLLYELGFYRAGFSWGLYYPHTCDGMHFSLSELSTAPFEDGPYAMRKVYDYLDNALKAPTITVQPTDAEVKKGTNVTFKVTAKGDALSYQWYTRSSPKGKWKKITKYGTSSTYTVKASSGKNGSQYRCLVKNYTGSVYTEPATLKIIKK